MSGAPGHAMTVDVEDWFHVQGFAGVIDRSLWPGLASRVEANTDALLEDFAACGVAATFFTLGWVAERHPAAAAELAADIAAAERDLDGDGRVLVRASGTEPLIRVMVEAATDVVAAAVAQRLADAVVRRFG